MNKPSDRTEVGVSENSDSIKIPKVVEMNNPGFRSVEQIPQDVLNAPFPKGSSMPLDRVNLRFIQIAVVVFLVVFCILEVKQCNDSRIDPPTATPVEAPQKTNSF